jgi:hypothetical protein
VLDDYARADAIRHRGHFMRQAVPALRARLWQAAPKPLPQQESLDV